MKGKKILLILALLCAIVQEAWSQNYDVWDGVTTTCPRYMNKINGSTGEVIYEWYVIQNAANLAYVTEHWNDGDLFYNKNPLAELCG